MHAGTCSDTHVDLLMASFSQFAPSLKRNGPIVPCYTSPPPSRQSCAKKRLAEYKNPALLPVFIKSQSPVAAQYHSPDSPKLASLGQTPVVLLSGILIVDEARLLRPVFFDPSCSTRRLAIWSTPCNRPKAASTGWAAPTARHPFQNGLASNAMTRVSSVRDLVTGERMVYRDNQVKMQ